MSEMNKTDGTVIDIDKIEYEQHGGQCEDCGAALETGHVYKDLFHVRCPNCESDHLIAAINAEQAEAIVSKQKDGSKEDDGRFTVDFVSKMTGRTTTRLKGSRECFIDDECADEAYPIYGRAILKLARFERLEKSGRILVLPEAAEDRVAYLQEQLSKACGEERAKNSKG